MYRRLVLLVAAALLAAACATQAIPPPPPPPPPAPPPVPVNILLMPNASTPFTVKIEPALQVQRVGGAVEFRLHAPGTPPRWDRVDIAGFAAQPPGLPVTATPSACKGLTHGATCSVTFSGAHGPGDISAVKFEVTLYAPGHTTPDFVLDPVFVIKGG